MSASTDRTRELVADHGWAVIKVPEDEAGPGFAYSVGLAERFDHPEVVISGLGLDLMHRLVNDAAAVVASGTALQAGSETDALLEGYPCAVRAASPLSYDYYFGEAARYYRGRLFDVVQVFWPDETGRYPWDSEYASAAQARTDLGAP